MNKINLDNISVPDNLSDVVDNAIEKAKTSSNSNATFRKTAAVAAAVVICFVTVITAANFDIVSAMRQLFVTPYNSGQQDNSRANALHNNFYVPVSNVTSESNGYQISMTNYYIDQNQAGFEYILTGKGLENYLDMVFAANRTLEIIYDNTSLIWKQDGDNNYTNASNMITPNISITKISENTYNLVDIIDFNRSIMVGDKINIHYGDLMFAKLGDIASDEDTTERKTIDGEWNFTIHVDEKFKNKNEMNYKLANADEAAKYGIECISMTATPLAVKLNLIVDFTKNSIADSQNMKKVSESKYTQKLNVMDLHGAIEIIADGKPYAVKSSDIENIKGNQVYCVFDIDSTYFQNVDSFSMRINEINGNVICLEFVREK